MKPSNKPLWTLTGLTSLLGLIALCGSGTIPPAKHATADEVADRLRLNGYALNPHRFEGPEKCDLPGAWSGSIDHKERYDVGERIKLACKVDAPLNATVARRWYGNGVSLTRVGDGTTVYGWGDAGQKTVQCVVAVYEPGEVPVLSVRKYSATFTIGPAPPPKPLVDLVDAKTAGKLAAALRATVEGLKIATPTDADSFLDGAFVPYFTSKGLTNNGAWPVILARVEAAAPRDKAFDAGAVSLVLTTAADELAKAPEPPGPQPPGPSPTPQKADKLWLVYLSKAGEATDAQFALLDNLSSWPTAPHKWVHYYTDGQDAQRYAKYAAKVPCLIVMDQATAKVLAVEVAPPDCPLDWPKQIAAKYTKGAN